MMYLDLPEELQEQQLLELQMVRPIVMEPLFIMLQTGRDMEKQLTHQRLP